MPSVAFKEEVWNQPGIPQRGVKEKDAGVAEKSLSEESGCGRGGNRWGNSVWESTGMLGTI